MHSTQLPILIQPSDRLLRKPIGTWWRGQSGQILYALQHQKYDLLSGALNQLSLLAAFRGHAQQATEICKQQIRLMDVLSKRHAQTFHGLAIQPWINLARLQRWKSSSDGKQSLYLEFSPESRSRIPSLCQYWDGATFYLHDLIQLSSEFERVLNHVFWREYGILLLQSGADQALQAHISAFFNDPARTPKLSQQLVEILWHFQYKRGHLQAAQKLLTGLKSAPGSIADLPCRSLELVLLARENSTEFEAHLHSLLQSVRQLQDELKSAPGLYLLQAIAQCLQHLNRPEEEAEILYSCLHSAQALDDEMLQFEVLRRLSELGRETTANWRERFVDCHYFVVRRYLDLPANTLEAEQSLLDVLQLIEQGDYASAILQLQ